MFCAPLFCDFVRNYSCTVDVLTVLTLATALGCLCQRLPSGEHICTTCLFNRPSNWVKWDWGYCQTQYYGRYHGGYGSRLLRALAVQTTERWRNRRFSRRSNCQHHQPLRQPAYPTDPWTRIFWTSPHLHHALMTFRSEPFWIWRDIYLPGLWICMDNLNSTILIFNLTNPWI